MNEITIIVLSLLLGLASGFIGGIATGGGMLSIPGLMLIGVPSSSAIATNNLTIASSISSAYRYNKHKKIQLRRVLPFLMISILGSLVGAHLLLHINERFMQKTFGIMCIGLAILFAFSKTAKEHKRNKAKDLLGLLAMFLTDVFAGLFGGGGGFFMVYILSYFYEMGIMEANANAKIIGLAGTLAALLTFLHAGIINFNAGLPLMIGSAAGGYIGAHTAIKKGDARVKSIFLLIVIVSGTKLILT